MTLRERKLHGGEKLSEKQNEQNEKFHEALYIIIFSQSAARCTIEWLVDLLQQGQHKGGAELLIQTFTENEETIIEINATPLRLLQAAEMMEITKEDKNGTIREFIFSSIDLFLKPGVDMNNLLNTSEKQRIILNEIMSLHSVDKNELFGHPQIKLYPGQSIVQVCKDHGIIKQIFPLHEPIELVELEKKWYTFPFTSLPLDCIRNYFGEAVGFYFAFLEFYTFALVPPAVVGLLQTIITLDLTHSYVLFAIFKMIWLTVFLENWKRKSNELAFTWGTLRTVVVPKLHPTFRGKALEIDPVTKQFVPVYPGYKRHFKVYCISTPAVVLCLWFAVVVMFLYFEIESFVMEQYEGSDSIFGWILMQLPGIVYAIVVFIMNCFYAKIANFLTEWENHKTQISYENHRVVKLLLFEFVNNFVAMGYIAFYLQDIEMLKWQIGIMMIVNQLINQFQEAILPVILQKFCKMCEKEPNSTSPIPRLQRVLVESKLWSYEGTYDDYLEMFIQFGYVFLFSSVYPLAAIFALINNVIEIWADAFKLCRSYQRPQARPVKGIGVWQIAFEILGVLSVMTNCALICMAPSVRSYVPDTSLTSWLLFAVAIEHIIIAVKMTLAYLITDVPKWVSTEMQRAQYDSLQALKMERKLKTKEILKSMKEKTM